jgi:hypothetical protein
MTKLTKIVNINKDNYDIYIGRGSVYGNPFIIGIDGTRKECIEKYKYFLINNKNLMKEILKLEGKILGCYCKPKACHGDIICDILNRKNFTL